jgi:hypothetical protein
VPELEASTWRMRMEGVVREPLMLGLDDLRRKAHRKLIIFGVFSPCLYILAVVCSAIVHLWGSMLMTDLS